MFGPSRSHLGGVLLICFAFVLVFILGAVGPAQAHGLHAGGNQIDYVSIGHPNRTGYDFRFEHAPGYPVEPFREPFAYSPGIYGYPLYPQAAYFPPIVNGH